MKKYLIVLILVVVGIVLLIREIIPEHKKNNFIMVAQGLKPKSLDPHLYNEFSTLAITEHVFNTLVTLNDQGNITPELAENWEYISEKEILFNLKKNVKFHNGKEMTEKDVVFSLQRMLKKPGSQTIVSDIESVKEAGKYRVLVKLKNPSAPLLYNLTMPLAAILNEEYSLESEEKSSLSPIGTGPFKIKKWDNGENIVLEKFHDYYKGSPKIDGIIFKVITENSSRLAALETGDIDIAYAISPIDFDTIIENPKLNLLHKLSTTTEFISLNVMKEGLKNKNLRKAIHHSINKEGILEAVFLGRGKIAKSPINPSIFGSYQELEGYEYNPSKAKEILKEENLENLNLKIWTSENILRVQIAQIIQSDLKDVGIKSTIEIVDLGTFLQKTSSGAHDILLTGWVLGASDSDAVMSALFHTSSIGSGGNRSFYSNIELDSELELARHTNDSEKRKNHYKKAQEIVADDNPVIPLIYKIDGIGVNKKIKNFQYNKSTMRNYYEVMEKE
ncbi:MAG: ABC transporter substrate-binding protein [Cetobacterium sp.]|uniref:ABC transporter substrate-binding protein n=1 Tax=Cetobacterium sp. TaxID=2071632 RepID=UPI002FC5CF4B